MNKHLVFVSYELYPINAGGCGVFISNAIKELLSSHNDIEITLVLDIPLNDIKDFEKKYKPNIIGGDRLRLVCVSEITKNINIKISFNDLNNIYLWKSYQFYMALLYVHNNIKKIDYIEFFDYVGIGFYAIRAQKYQRCFGNCLTAIRAHCTIDLMDIEQKQVDFNEEKIVMYQMEKMALQDCDILLSPSESWGNLYCNRYGLSNKKVLISPPPMNAENIPMYKINKEQGDVLFYGRIFELKGVDVFVDAAIMYLLQNIDSKTKFYLVGYESKTVNGKNYAQYLIEKIPLKLRDRFIFTGQLNKNELNEILKTIAVAVFPNYVESFCYSIHELYEAGVPIICREIIAFRDYFINHKNCLYFDGTSSDLSKKIQYILQNYSVRTQLSRPYKVLDIKLFNDNYNEIINSNKNIIVKNNHEELGNISLILIDEYDNRNKRNMNWSNNLVSTSASYYIVPCDDDVDVTEKDIIVWLLGRKLLLYPLFQEKINPMLPLEKYVWIGYYNDKLASTFFAEALNCFNESKELQFVSSYIINNKKRKKYCYHSDITCFNIFDFNDVGLRTLYKNSNKLSLRDIVDNRLDSLSFKFQKYKGYVIPDFLIEISNDRIIKIKPEVKVLFCHQLSRNKEWYPFNLYPLIKNSRLKVKKNIIRSLYHNIKIYSDSENGLRGKMLLKVINKLHKIYKTLKST